MSQGPDRSKPPAVNSPLVLVPILIAIAMVFCTIMWFGARRETAALYGMVRSVEFPFINKLVPHAQHFSMEALQTGRVPSFIMIYENSLIYGLFFAAMIMVLMMVALSRLDKFSILKFITIKSDKGRSYEEVMDKLAQSEPSVRFFADYHVLDLPTTEGTARQPMRAIELLLYTNTIRHIEVDREGKQKPRLVLDEDRLRDWMVSRFGPENPFVSITQRRLLDVSQIHSAVDELSWYAALVLYPAIYRVHAFYVETEGFDTANDEIDAFINGIWDELNGFKREFKDGIQLGFADDADREERDALYIASLGSKKKKRKKKRKNKHEDEYLDVTPSTVIDNFSDFARTFRRGRIDRGELPTEATVHRASAGDRPSKKPQPPEHLLFFGEVLSERGPNLQSVKKARDGLKDILTRHLGQTTKRYPVGMDKKTKLVIYEKGLKTAEEKAFNNKAQERLGTAARAVERVLFSHQYEFSMTGGMLEATRAYGIMPPALFRWMRFSDETTPFWYFVQNLGMPAAYPENAAHFEHYQAEKAMEVAVETPHVLACVDGINAEASRYLVPETISELQTVLGKDAIVFDVIAADTVSQVMEDFGRIVTQAANAGAAAARPSSRQTSSRPKIGGSRPSTEPEAREMATRDAILDDFDLDDEA